METPGIVGGSAADFFAELQPVNNGQQPAQIVQQPQMNQQPEPQVQPTPPTSLTPEQIKAVEQEIQKDVDLQLKLNSDIDSLLQELLPPSPTPAPTTDENIKNSLENSTQMNNPVDKNSGIAEDDDVIPPEEQHELLDMIEELEEQLELNSIEMQSQIERLSFKNDLLNKEVLKYAEKAQALERDVKIAPKVPDDLEKFFLNYQEGVDGKDTLAYEITKKEFLRLAERFFKRKLDDYISDVYTLGDTDISSGGGGGLNQYDIRGLVSSKPKQTPQETIVEQMMQHF